jgi:hypothetical protein
MHRSLCAAFVLLVLLLSGEGIEAAKQGQHHQHHVNQIDGVLSNFGRLTDALTQWFISHDEVPVLIQHCLGESQ